MPSVARMAEHRVAAASLLPRWVSPAACPPVLHRVPPAACPPVLHRVSPAACPPVPGKPARRRQLAGRAPLFLPPYPFSLPLSALSNVAWVPWVVRQRRSNRGGVARDRRPGRAANRSECGGAGRRRPKGYLAPPVVLPIDPRAAKPGWPAEKFDRTGFRPRPRGPRPG